MKCKLPPRMCVAEDAGIRHRKLPKLRTMPFLASSGHLYEYPTNRHVEPYPCRAQRMTLELRACLIWSYWEILSSTTLNTRAAAQTLCRKFATYYHQDGAHRYSPSMGLRLLTFPTRFSACRKRAPISYSVLGVTTGVGALKNIFEAQYPARPYPCLRFAAVLTTS